MAPVVSRLVRFGLLVFALLGFVLVPFVLWGDAIEAWAAQRLSTENSSILVALAGCALLAVDILLPVPSSLVGVILGATLGVASATLVGTIGLTLGCGLGYWIGRMAGPSGAGRFVTPEELQTVQAWLNRHGILALALLRPVPVLAEASVVAAGLMGMPPLRVLGATALSNVGVSAIYTSVGATASGLTTFILALAAAFIIPVMVLLGAKLVRRAVARP